MQNKTKEIDFQCKYCNYTWTEVFPEAARPSVEKKCPKCNKIGEFLKEYNWFTSMITGKK